MGNRQVNGPTVGQSGIEIIRDFHRTDVYAFAATDAPVRVHPVGMLLERDLKVAGFAGNRTNFCGKKNFDVFVKQPFAKTVLGACVPIDQGQHFAHPTAIGGKLVIKLAQNSSQVGRPVDQSNAIAELCQIQCGPDTADTSPYDQSFADFFVHQYLRTIVFKGYDRLVR
jgi:hypothetical protein